MSRQFNNSDKYHRRESGLFVPDPGPLHTSGMSWRSLPGHSPCCEGGGAGPIECPGCPYDGAAPAVQLTFSEIVPLTGCDDCDDLNDTFILEFTNGGSTYCTWRYSIDPMICEIDQVILTVSIDGDERHIAPGFTRATFPRLTWRKTLTPVVRCGDIGPDEIIPFNARQNYGFCDGGGTNCLLTMLY